MDTDFTSASSDAVSDELLQALLELSAAHELGHVTAVVRAAVRSLMKADGVTFVRQQMPTYSENTRRESALADFCQVLLCLNEFVYVD